MGCMLLLLEYYGLAGVQGGGVTMTTGLLRGLGLLVERGRSVHAMSLVHACLVGKWLCTCIRACVHARGGGGWGQAEYYGLSVAR